MRMPKALPVTRGRKFLQVLEGARTIFLRDGFEGAAVDDIAREAGVSKATLYSYFPDKRIMFMEVFRSELTRKAVNDWLRTDGAREADAVVDFDRAVRDPSNPSRFRPDLHSGDWLHPSDAGYQAMADVIPLNACD